MQISNVELPGAEEFQASSSAHWFPRVRNILLYKKYMKAVYGLSLDFNLSYDFDAVRDAQFTDPKTKQPIILKVATNDFYSSVFLSKQATDIWFFDQSGARLNGEPLPAQVKKIVMIYGDYFQVAYHPADKAAKKSEVFEISNIALDYMNPKPIQARQAFLERAKAAMILVQTAKEAGWTSINFAGTSDPLERYYLKRACDLFHVDCSSEKIDPTLIPVNSAFQEGMVNTAEEILSYACEDIMRNPKRSQSSPAADNDDFDIPEMAA